VKRSSFSAAAPLQRISIRVGRSAGLAPRIAIRRPRALGFWRVTVGFPRLASTRLASGRPCFSRMPVWTTHHPFASSLRRHVTPLACASASLARDRPLTPKQSAPCGHYGQTRHDRPDPRTLSSDRAPLLRFSSPSAYVSRVARTPKAAGLRNIPLRRFAPAAPAHCREPRSAACRPCGFSLLAKSRPAQLDLADVRGGSFDRRQRVARPTPLVVSPPVTHSSIDRTRLPSSAIRRTGAVGVTDAHASRPDPSNRALPLAISSPEPGHAPTRPLARCSATRCSGCRTALPDEGPSLTVTVRRRSWGFCPSQV
jgi:hypothetical protein